MFYKEVNCGSSKSETRKLLSTSFALPNLLFYSALFVYIFIPSFTVYLCGLMGIYLIHCGTRALVFVFVGPVSLWEPPPQPMWAWFFRALPSSLALWCPMFLLCQPRISPSSKEAGTCYWRMITVQPGATVHAWNSSPGQAETGELP